MWLGVLWYVQSQFSSFFFEMDWFHFWEVVGGCMCVRGLYLVCGRLGMRSGVYIR